MKKPSNPDPKISSGVGSAASGSCRSEQPPSSSLHPSPSGALPLRAGYPRRRRGWAPAHRATRWLARQRRPINFGLGLTLCPSADHVLSRDGSIVQRGRH